MGWGLEEEVTRRAGAGLRAGDSWRKLRDARAPRMGTAVFTLPEGKVPKNDAARRFWSERTWSEFAAVPAVSQVVLALVRQGAPLEVLGAYTAIADDEVRHAMLSRDLAERLGGYVDEVPEGLDYAPSGLARPQGRLDDLAGVHHGRHPFVDHEVVDDRPGARRPRARGATGCHQDRLIGGEPTRSLQQAWGHTVFQSPPNDERPRGRRYLMRKGLASFPVHP